MVQSTSAVTRSVEDILIREAGVSVDIFVKALWLILLGGALRVLGGLRLLRVSSWHPRYDYFILQRRGSDAPTNDSVLPALPGL